MQAIFLREIAVVSRRASLVAAACVYLGILAAFLIVWRDGVPIWTGAALHEQFGVIRLWALTVVVPWAAARCAAGERGDDLVRLAALCALRPSRVVAAKAAALGGALAVLALAGLPFALFAQQRAAAPVGDVLAAEAALAGFAAAAAVSTFVMSRLMVSGPLTGWLAGAAVTAAMSTTAFGGARGALASGAICVIVGVAAAASAAVHADTSLRYLSEPAG